MFVIERKKGLFSSLVACLNTLVLVFISGCKVKTYAFVQTSNQKKQISFIELWENDTTLKTPTSMFIYGLLKALDTRKKRS